MQFSADETIPVEAAYFVAGVDIELTGGHK